MTPPFINYFVTDIQSERSETYVIFVEVIAHFALMNIELRLIEICRTRWLLIVKEIQLNHNVH